VSRAPVPSTSATARARVGLLGNPSDGYGGRVLAFTLRERGARVTASPTDRPGFALRGEDGELRAADLDDLRAQLHAGAGDGGQRLLAAACLQLATRERAALDAAARAGLALAFESDVPRQSGLAGSSAIVVAALRALCSALGTELPPLELAALALRAETEELGIAAGPQDRVVQAFEGLLFMDFADATPRAEQLDPALLPPLFLAWPRTPGASSGGAHGDLRARHASGDRAVHAALRGFARIADEGLAALRAGERDVLAALMDESFELRRSVMDVAPRDQELVALGRAHDAAVKLPGSGGAVVGLPRRDGDRDALEAAYRAAGCGFLRPTVAAPE
jgi:glucuronokinase